MDDAKTCPRCGSEQTVPLIYGMPTDEAAEEARRGEVALGGCVVFPDAPDHTCRNCGYEWREYIR